MSFLPSPSAADARATDIDGISIRTDTEAKGVGGRSYNYRVRRPPLVR